MLTIDDWRVMYEALEKEATGLRAERDSLIAGQSILYEKIAEAAKDAERLEAERDAAKAEIKRWQAAADAYAERAEAALVAMQASAFDWERKAWGLACERDELKGERDAAEAEAARGAK